MGRKWSPIGHDLAHPVIHPADFTGHSAATGVGVVEGFVVMLPGMHGVAREGMQRLVGVISCMAVLGLVEHEFAERVGTVVGEVEEERAVFVGLNELDAFAGPKIGRIAESDTQLSVLDHLLVIEFQRAAIGFGGPRCETFTGYHVCTQVPFATEAAGVAGIA